MKKSLNLITFLLFFNIIFSSISISVNSQKDLSNNKMLIDYDPLININITVKIDSIRALKQIKNDSDKSFFIKIFINNLEFISPLFNESEYLYNLNFSITTDVPDNAEIVEIKIQLYEKVKELEVQCDISGEINNSDKINDAILFYNIKTGHWNGSDYINDSSGYGRLNGCDDGSIYTQEKDCELWFDIYQNDYDNDTIPYWTEVNTYHTDPEIKNSGDPDNDKIPVEWEYKWGYNPFIWENHTKIDPDKDSLNNYEEYLTSKWLSDPYRKDIFLEIDWMEEGPNGEKSIIPEEAKDRLKNPFHRRNIVFHLDTGELEGGELIPFEYNTNQATVLDIYNNYFIHNVKNNWRRGVFHYGIIVYLCDMKGYGFSGDTSPYWGYIPGTNSFVISSSQMEKNTQKIIYEDKTLENFYSSAIMHEMGHNFGIKFGKPIGCDNWFAKYPWQISYWLIRDYKSLMNYQYTYRIFDYSDGSNGKRDYNDWAAINLSYFEKP